MVVGDASPSAYVGVLPDERTATAAILTRVVAALGPQGIPVARALIDNGACSRAHAFAQTARQLGEGSERTRPYWPQTADNAEALVRTLLRRTDLRAALPQQREPPDRPLPVALCLQSLPSPHRARRTNPGKAARCQQTSVGRRARACRSIL